MIQKKLINYYQITNPHNLSSTFCASNKLLNKNDDYKIKLLYQIEYDNMSEIKDDYRVHQVLDNLREYHKLETIKRKNKMKIYQKRYNEANKDAIRQQQKQYQQANQDKINARRRFLRKEKREENVLKNNFLNILNDRE